MSDAGGSQSDLFGRLFLGETAEPAGIGDLQTNLAILFSVDQFHECFLRVLLFLLWADSNGTVNDFDSFLKSVA